MEKLQEVATVDNLPANYRLCFAQFLEQSERSPHTIKNYLCDLDAFARWFENSCNEELTPVDTLRSKDTEILGSLTRR